ncbi:hypothetical protein GUJ93_ZPchr0004g38446 [Zizania palustris]|uniref:Uncharacterized protein n=1 Tax=Zizania palustris TaxID=103762 RepID=A0A8J5VYZ2_ZIZPA|nr:hypothetical protein GUJ93_ZPchr0004g38446 [Zizania palustris]
MWFRPHETCPLCCVPVSPKAGEVTAEGLPRVPCEDSAMEFPMFPTNVLFWGTHDDCHQRRPLIPTTTASSHGRCLDEHLLLHAQEGESGDRHLPVGVHA